MKKIMEFLKEYEKLCQKYGMGIEGCGCCGSPFIGSQVSDINYYENENIVKIEWRTIEEYEEYLKSNGKLL